MLAFRLFDVEGDAFDPLVGEKIIDLARRAQTFRRQHRDHRERDLLPLQQAEAGDDPVKRAASRVIEPVEIGNAARSVDAEAYVHSRLAEELAPGLIDERAVGLQARPHHDIARTVALDDLMGLAVEVDSGRSRLAGVPTEVDLALHPAGAEELAKQIIERCFAGGRFMG